MGAAVPSARPASLVRQYQCSVSVFHLGGRSQPLLDVALRVCVCSADLGPLVDGSASSGRGRVWKSGTGPLIGGAVTSLEARLPACLILNSHTFHIPPLLTTSDLSSSLIVRSSTA